MIFAEQILTWFHLETGCQKALQQIEENDYADRLIDDGMTTILKYGIACCKHTCMVQMPAGWL